MPTAPNSNSPSTPTSTSTRCAHCARPLAQYFEIIYHNSRGRVAPPVNVCSIRCLISWGYTYAMKQGLRGVEVAKATIAQIGKFIQGGGTPP